MVFFRPFWCRFQVEKILLGWRDIEEKLQKINFAKPVIAARLFKLSIPNFNTINLRSLTKFLSLICFRKYDSFRDISVQRALGPGRAGPVQVGNGFRRWKQTFFVITPYFKNASFSRYSIVLFPYITGTGAHSLREVSLRSASSPRFARLRSQKLIIYYKNRTISQLVMKNNLSQKQNISPNERSHLVYEFKCREGDCITQNNTYIGMTTCKLRERFEHHKTRGSIFEHFRVTHNRSPCLQELLNSTEIIYEPDNPLRVDVFEALLIRQRKPKLNENQRNFPCLKLNIFWGYHHIMPLILFEVTIRKCLSQL